MQNPAKAAPAPVRIGVIVPDRGDRPDFLLQCQHLLLQQTLAPVVVLIVGTESKVQRIGSFTFVWLNVPPVAGVCDITKRYRIGYEWFNGPDSPPVDVLAWIENDDWYHKNYLREMARQWVKAKRPHLFGTAYTMYYHLGLQRWRRMHHKKRASAMNTFIMPHLQVEWCADTEPYTDQHLWMLELRRIADGNRLKGGPAPEPNGDTAPAGGIQTRVTWYPDAVLGYHLAIGLKHGTGLCGGRYHTDLLEQYNFADPQGQWLQQQVDAVSWEFYRGMISASTDKHL